MLRIKNNIDLKELEKFGIKKYGEHYNAITGFKIPYFSILGEQKRKIKVYNDIGLDLLFELIASGLVEKVVERWEKKNC